MKKKLLLVCLFLAFLFIGCNNKDVSADVSTCGCDADSTKSIPQSSELSAKMFYKYDSPESNYYINKFWIEYTEPNCGNCTHSFVICNENILENNYDDVKELPKGERIDITFSGNIKPICDLPNAWLADTTFERIILTSIQRK